MEAAKPSRTALGVAVRRASHQIYDAPPRVLDDPMAVPILGESYRAALEDAAGSIHERSSVSMRAWVVARSRFAEDNLARAVGGGVRQYVVLGAGLDTFAHRNPHPDVRVFEVDHPATQAWKRSMIAENGLPEPERLQYVPVDFEQESLARRLEESGLDLAAPTVFAWLGVALYLTLPAFRATVAFVAGFPEGSGVTLDYALPRHALPADELEARDVLAARVESLGEPFRLFFTAEEIATEFRQFRALEDLDSNALHARYFAGRTDRLSLAERRSGRMLCAWR